MRKYIQGGLGALAAGAEITEVPNSGDTFRLVSFRAKLVTSATVANRFPHFQIVTPSGNVLHEIVPKTAQAASLTVIYNLIGSSGVTLDGSTPVDGVSSLPLPDLWFPAGTKLQTLTTAIAAGDAWSAVYFSAYVGEEQMILAELAAEASRAAS